MKSILSVKCNNYKSYIICDLPIVSEVTLVINITDPKTIVDIKIDAPINALHN